MAADTHDGYEDPGPSRRVLPSLPTTSIGGTAESHSLPASTSGDSQPSTAPPLLRTLSQTSTLSFKGKAKLSLHIPDLPRRVQNELHTSLSHLDLPVHLEQQHVHIEQEHGIDGDTTPHAHRKRKGTYSSLPSSPKIQAIADFDEGLGSRRIGDVIGALARDAGKDPPRLEYNPNSESSEDDRSGEEGYHECDIEHGASSSTDDGAIELAKAEVENDVFWPARSRRPTNEAGAMSYTAPNGEVSQAKEKQRDTETIPESPTSPEPPLSESDEEKTGKTTISSLWDVLKDDAGDEVWDGWIVDGKWERIANFLAVPIALERTILFGSLLCLDGFLYNFTVLPIRSTVALVRMFKSAVQHRPAPLPLSHLHAILRMLLVLIPTMILLGGTNASKMYHSVRGQDTIKLYVIFNALEIADRLCGAFGQDVLDTLFARETLAPMNPKRGRGRKRQQARPLFFFMLALGYVLAHSLIFFYMLVSLNVAINSYDYTLLSLLISNQFVEIKGSVFKKFEKENLFQIMCADIVERFQLSLMLAVIAVRNLIEMSGSDIAFLPKSFMRGKGLVDAIFSPVLFVIISEMIVDWLKHAFITKFNHVRASVYGRYADVLAKDVLVAGSITGDGRIKRRTTPVLLDQSPLVARRLGFASTPLACLVIRIGAQVIGMLTLSAHSEDEPSLSKGGLAWMAFKWVAGIGLGISAWGCLVALKVLLGISLLSYSVMRQTGMDEREAEDAVNDFGRSAVGESKEETEYNKQTTAYLSQVEDDLEIHTSPTSAAPPLYSDTNEKEPLARPAKSDKPAKEAKAKATGKKGKKWQLEEVERWTMVKRIW